MNEIDVIRLKLQNSNTIFDVISACKLWRTVILKGIKKKARKYQIELSDKMIEYVLSEGLLGDEIVALYSRQCLDGDTLVLCADGKEHKIKDVGFFTGINKVYKVKSDSGNELICTMDHKFITEENGDRELSIILDKNYKVCVDGNWEHIKLIDYAGERETYNMSVPILEGYIANGIWVKNSGKTETVAFTVLAIGTFYILFLKQEFLCGLFAPVESMTTHVTRNRVRKMYNMVAKWLEDNGLVLIAGRGVTSSIFILKDKYSGAEFYIRALSVGEQSETIGETFKLMIIEQSELVNALKLTNDVFPMGAAKGGCRVLTGTTSPYFKNDYFKSAIQKWNSDPSISKSTADSVIMVDWKRASKESVAYARYCKKMRDKLGEDNIAFKTQFNLQWVSAAVKFIGWEDLAMLEKDYISDKENLRFYGIDLARAGDSTVVTVIEKDGLESHIIGWLELQGMDFEDYGVDMKRKGQITKIVEFLKQFKPLRYGLVDKANIGIAPYDMFKKRLWDKELDENGVPTGKHIAWTRVGPFHASVKENDKMAKCMDREFQHKRIHYPKHTQYRREKNKFTDQILDVDRKYSGYTLKLQAPKTMGSHDDFVISLGLAIYAMKEKSFRGGIANVNI